jgi:hypothetical protein
LRSTGLIGPAQAKLGITVHEPVDIEDPRTAARSTRSTRSTCKLKRITSWNDVLLKSSQGKEILVSYLIRVVIGFVILSGIAYFVLRGLQSR